MNDKDLVVEIKALRRCIKDLTKAITLLEKRIEKKGEKTMPSIEHMRSAISDAYPGEGWKFRCEHMHANQVIAIYRSLMKRGAFDSEPDERKFIPLSKKEWGYINNASKGVKDYVETATDAPRFVPYTGVQLSMFDI